MTPCVECVKDLWTETRNQWTDCPPSDSVVHESGDSHQERTGVMSWQAHRAIEYGREVIGQTRDDLAAALTTETGEEWSYQMVAKLENGRKLFTVDLLQAVAKVQGLPYEWYLVDPRSNLNGFRGFDSDIPGYLNSAVELPGVPADNLNHHTTSCVDCLIDQNHLVAAEWLTPGGELPGQTRIVIDLTEAAFTYAEAV